MNTGETDTCIETWGRLCRLFPMLGEVESIANEEEVEEALNFFKAVGQTDQCCKLVWAEIEAIILHEIAPKFWDKFITEPEDDLEAFNAFHLTISTLFKKLVLFENIIKTLGRLEANSAGKFESIVQGVLLAKAPYNHQKVVKMFFSLSFKVFCHSENAHDDSLEELLCQGCSQETDHCLCKEILAKFSETNSYLVRLGLMERLAGEQLRELLQMRIKSHVQELCKGSFSSHLAELETWLETVVMAWLNSVYEEQDDFVHSLVLELSIVKLRHFLYETYTKIRVEEFFNIIIEFPESQPALEDLRICLQKTDMRSYLTTKLQSSLEVRLLHPGANTVDILITYVAAIRALRLLDPSGVLLDTVTTPIRQYLRQREDTVRCVVTNLTEEGPSELAEELAKGNALDETVDSDDDMEDWVNWQPPPVDADTTDSGQSKRSSDIISMLVSVYGSKELFVNEYRILLADRLLSQFNCNTDKEIRYLELLKRRFGDSQLHYCEVMLKDVQDSKRMNTHLASCPDLEMYAKDFTCTAIILSAQFWPPFKEENLEVPPVVKEHLDDYTKAFEALKGNRTLSWKPHLGYVNLDIELKDRTLNLTVSPIHATIIWHFQEKPQWTIEDLSQVMQISGTLLRRKISFWQSQGILREQSPDVFVLMEEGAARAGSTGRSADHVACEDEEMESALASAHEQREGELQVFWSYIVGMLTNLDSMPLERIHQMLRMFASQGPTAVECSQQELRHFLDRKVREHQLLFSGGLYKLPKP